MKTRPLRDPVPLRIAARVLPRAVRDEILVELRDQHARIGLARRRPAVWLWLWRQPLTAIAARVRWNERDVRRVRSRPAFTLRGDLIVAARRLRKTPLFTIFAIATLALGIGATTGIYSIVRAAMAPPPGVRDVHEIVNITLARGSSRGLSVPDFEDFRARQTRLAHVSAWRHIRLSLASGGRSLTSFGELVSGDYFQALGVLPMLGRTIQRADDLATAPPVVVLGHTAWIKMFDGRPDVIGRTVAVNGLPFVIVGVTPPQFNGLINNGLTRSMAWVPLATASSFRYLGGAERLRDRGTPLLRVHGRRAPGTAIDDVQAEVTAIAAQLDGEIPVDRGSRRAQKRSWSVIGLADVKVSPDAGSLAGGLTVAVMGAVVLVLLVACTNLANLMLARGAGRRHEITVRHALGATRWRLTSEGALETFLLALVGGAAGVCVARVLSLSIHTELDLGSLSLIVEPRLDGAVLTMATAAMALVLFVAGVVPAWMSSAGGVRGALAVDTGQAVLPRWRGRRLLITAQVAVSVLLLAVTTLFASQIRAHARHDSGLDLDRIAMAHIDFIDQRVDEPRARQIVDRVLDQLVGRPTVEAAASSSGLPVGPLSRTAYISQAGAEPIGVAFVSGTASMFDVLGVTIVAGRGFVDRDAPGTDAVAVLNETAARTLFGGLDVLGRQVTVKRQDTLGEPPQRAQTRTVIGVASDSDAEAFGRRDAGVVYVPWSQQFDGRIVISVRTSGDPANRLNDLRHAVAAVAPDLAVAQLGTGVDVAGPANLFGEIAAGVSGVLGLFGLIMALVGLGGLLSHLVARRTREIGVRLALGATTAQARQLVLRDGLRPAAIGVAVGIALATATQQALQRVSPTLVPPLDIAALGILTVLMFAVGALACYLPARRASRVDPLVALRDL
jgi:predicted permease